MLPSTKSLNEFTEGMVGGESMTADRFGEFPEIRDQQYCRSVRWFDALASEELPDGQVFTIERAGGDIVLWRSASGRPIACEARCPHQWAHLGSAGAVDGDELVCLSHFWRFDADGHGSKLAADGRRDEKGPIGTFMVREVDGRIEVELSD